MKTNSVLFIIIAGFLILGSTLFLPNDTDLFTTEETDKTEESNAKQQWLLQLLADPATGKIPYNVNQLEREFYTHNQAENRTLYKARQANWVMQGPINVGGRTRTIKEDVTNPNVLLTGAVAGGIWRSTDAGINWTRVSNPNEHPSVISITQDVRPHCQHIWYALSGELYGTSASGTGAFYLGDGAFRSLDSGKTWKPLASTAGGTPNSFTSAMQGGWRIAASPVDTVNACVYMAMYGGIYRSKDTGNTWTLILGASNDSYYTDVAVSKTGIVYATLSSDGATTKGFFRSADGIHFTNITPTFYNTWNRSVLEINPNNENEVYFLTHLEDTLSTGGIRTSNYEGVGEWVSLVKYTYLSGDGNGTGGKYDNLSQNLPVTSANPFDKFNCQNGYDLVVRVQPVTNNVFIGGTNLYRSTDGFTTPNNTTQIGGYGLGTTLPYFQVYPQHHPDNHDLFFSTSNPSTLYSASDGGISMTKDCNASTVVWERKNEGYITSQFYTVTINNERAFSPWMIGGLQDNGNYVASSNNPAHHWVMPVNGDGAFNYIASNHSFYIFSTQLGRIVKTKLDDIGNLLSRRRIDPVGFTKNNYSFINPFIVDPLDENILYLPIGKRILRQNNLKSIEVNNEYTTISEGWTQLTDSIKTPNINATTPSKISCVAMSKDPSHTLYMGTNNQQLYKIVNVHTGNPVFTKMNTAGLPAANVNAIAIDPDSVNHLLICFSNYNVNSIYYTPNAGVNWYLVGGNLEGSSNSSGGNPSVRSVAILKHKDGRKTYFCGTSVGLYSTDTLYTTASLNHWNQESPDLIGAAVVTDIKTRNADGFVAVATHSNGLFTSYYTGGMPPIRPSVVNSNSLYPNPAHQSVQYTFTVEKETSIRINIVDMMGRKIFEVQNEQHYLAGTFTLSFAVDKLPNGRYFLVQEMQGNIKPSVKSFLVYH